MLDFNKLAPHPMIFGKNWPRCFGEEHLNVKLTDRPLTTNEWTDDGFR